MHINPLFFSAGGNRIGDEDSMHINPFSPHEINPTVLAVECPQNYHLKELRKALQPFLHVTSKPEQANQVSRLNIV